MKKFLSLVLTLTLAFVFFGFGNQTVDAEVPAPTCTTAKVVVVHYKRWNDDYESMDFWTWGNGTNGSVDAVPFVGEDDFGKVAYICVDEDAGHEAGLIPRKQDWSYKDGVDLDMNDGGDNKAIQLREPSDDDELTTEDFVGFDENGMKHVYVLQGSGEVYYNDPTMPMFQKDGFGTLVVVYYDPVESYDGWNMWTWGTGTDGTQAPNYFQWDLGEDQGQVADKFKVAVFNIAADADDTIGFIVRTDSWEKQWGEDLFIDVTAIKGSGTQFTFYIGGAADLYDNFTDFEAQVNLFEIVEVEALDQHSIELEFNKDIVTADEAGNLLVDTTNFMVVDKDGNTIALDRVSYDSQSESNAAFTLITTDALMGMASPFTVKYINADMDEFTKELVIDSTPPVIDIAGFTEVEIELGDTYQLPIFSASDFNGEESVKVAAYIKEGFGTVDTRNAGVYEIVLVAEDNFGNVRERTITVTVIDPCDDTAHLQANNNTNLIALLVGAPLAVGAIVTLRRYY